MEFFKTGNKYQSDKKSGHFYKACPERLTLLPFDSKLMRGQVYIDKTPFKEVMRVPYKESPEVTELHNELESCKKSDSFDFADALFNALMDSIEFSWKPEKFHLIGHSSGYDSRIISHAIMLLAKKNGKEWLGEILFVENHGECDSFKEIMKIQGWDKSQYFSYNEQVKPELFHAGSLVFSDFHKKFNGIGSYPVNPFYDAFARMQQRDILPKSDEIQYYTGYGSEGITFQSANHSLRYYAEWHSNLQLNFFNTIGETIYPFWNFNFMKMVFYYSKTRLSRASELISKTVSPELNHIFKYRTGDVVDKGYRHIGSSVMDEIWNSYINSWYGKRNSNIKVDNFVNYCNWWGHYCLASMCEYLISKGHKISMYEYD